MDAKTEVLLNSTVAYCGKCKTVEQARIVARENGVFMERLCSKHGIFSAMIASEHEWYTERLGKPQKIVTIKQNKKSEKGCPFDCGICQWHTGSLKLPVFSITNDCNMNCPKCFTYNRPDEKYYKSKDDTKKIIDHILNITGGVQLINLTGGEPTLHPDLFGILEMCKQTGVERITMNTNGLRIADDKKLAKKIKEFGIQLVFSLDTLDSRHSELIYGEDIIQKKLKALKVIEELDIPTTILSVCIKNLNENDIGNIVKNFMKKDFVRSFTIQNMTFTGGNGSRFHPREHITIDEVEKVISFYDKFSQDDFFPLGAYHPLCYSVAYYIVSDNIICPLTKILDKNIISEMSEGCYLLASNQNYFQNFVEGVNKLWASGESEDVIKMLKNLVKELYENNTSQNERKCILEEKVKMIYIHSHMDEDNFDIDRISRCGDLVPDESGNMIPACSYNLLYRQKDQRFWRET